MANNIIALASAAGVISWATLAAAAHAQDSCHDVLVQTIISDVNTMSKRVAYLHLINTIDDWQEAKSSAGGLKAVFDDVTADASTSFSGFKAWKKSTLDQLDYKLSDDEAHSY